MMMTVKFVIALVVMLFAQVTKAQWGCEQMNECFDPVRDESIGQKCFGQIVEQTNLTLSDPDSSACSIGIWSLVKTQATTSFGSATTIPKCIQDKYASKNQVKLTTKQTLECAAKIDEYEAKTLKMSPRGEILVAKAREWLSLVIPTSEPIQQCINDMVELYETCYSLLVCCPTFLTCQKELNIRSSEEVWEYILGDMEKYINCSFEIQQKTVQKIAN